MNLHPTVIDRLIKIFEVYGGHREQTRLRNELMALALGTYTRQDGRTIVVLEKDLNPSQPPGQ